MDHLDKEIFENVCETLLRDKRIDASQVEVSVKNSVVMLRGQIGTQSMKDLAQRCVEELPIVGDVRNELATPFAR